MTRGLPACLLMLGCALADPVSAQAHSEAFADAKIEIVGNSDARLAAVRNVWRMDAEFSASVLEEFDANADGALSEGELAEVGRTIKDSIAEWDYYTVVEADSKKVAMRPPDEIHALWEEGQLLLFFEVEAAEPVDLASATVSVTNFDPSFFAHFRYPTQDGFRLVGMPSECRLAVKVPDEDQAAKAWIRSVEKLGADKDFEDEGAASSKILATRAEVTCRRP